MWLPSSSRAAAHAWRAKSSLPADQLSVTRQQQQTNQLMATEQQQGDHQSDGQLSSLPSDADQLIGMRQKQGELLQVGTRPGDQLFGMRQGGTKGRWRVSGGDLLSAGRNLPDVANLGFYSLGPRPQDSLDTLQVNNLPTLSL